jgi:hypothetical protein
MYRDYRAPDVRVLKEVVTTFASNYLKPYLFESFNEMFAGYGRKGSHAVTDTR